MTKLTVGLPMFNARHVGWLALEGLVNMDHPNVDWELIIMEEVNGKELGIEGIEPYVDAITDKGCVSIRYYGLDYWIPLPQKWKNIAQKASKESEVFCFVPADAFIPKGKIKSCYEKITSGVDWYGYQRAYLYNIISKTLIEYDTESIGWNAGILAATRTEYVANIEDSWQNKGIDSLLYRSIRADNQFREDNDDWKTGFSTDGMNSISLNRRNRYNHPTPPFFKTDEVIESVTTNEIIERLNASYNLFKYEG